MMRFWLTLVLLTLAASPLRAEGRLNVVASFSVLADLVKNVGGDRIELATLVGPDNDVHVYTPTPSDAKKVADARILFINGLALEGWLPRLVQSAGSKAIIVKASDGIALLKRGSETDPHAWQSVANAKIYVVNIRNALAAADPADADAFRVNADRYLMELDTLEREVRAAVASIAPGRRKAISTHDAFGYFSEAYGIAFIAPSGVSTETEPSARDVAALVNQIKAEKILAVFLENVSDERLIRRIAAEAGAKAGGTLYSDSLTGEKGSAPTYIDLVRHNIKALTSALGN